MRKVQGEPLPTGVSVRGKKVNFSAAFPKGAAVSLLLYEAGGEEPCAVYDMTESLGEVRYLALTGLEGTSFEYNYLVDGRILTDPYARAVTGCGPWGEAPDPDEHTERAVLYNTPYDWEGDTVLQIPDNEVVAYGLHIRGFTQDPHSKVKHKGTFEGAVEKIPYLKDLGINQIQCMPVYEFRECGRTLNYWGYGDGYFFAPKKAYAAGEDPVRSLKDMVKAFHASGIEVVLEMPFASDTSKLLIEECLRFYRMEYHIDGFVLNPLVAPMETIQSDPILKGTKILQHETDYQTVMRRYLKGDEGMIESVIYQLRHIPGEGDGYNYIADHCGFTLADLVSYDGKHNEANGEQNQDGPDYNYSWNCGAEGPTRKKAVLELRKRQVRNAFFLLLFSQGTPYIHAGDEFGNSQKGNNNVYCQDNTIGWVNWQRLDKEQELYDFVKALIRLRKQYPVFHPDKEMQGIDTVGCGVPDVSYHGESAWRVPTEVSSRQLGVYYSGAPFSCEDCFVAYNMHWLEHDFALPSLKKGKYWYLLASTEDGVLEEPQCLKDQRKISLSARTVAILTGR